MVFYRNTRKKFFKHRAVTAVNPSFKNVKSQISSKLLPNSIYLKPDFVSRVNSDGKFKSFIDGLLTKKQSASEFWLNNKFNVFGGNNTPVNVRSTSEYKIYETKLNEYKKIEILQYKRELAERRLGLVPARFLEADVSGAKKQNEIPISGVRAYMDLRAKKFNSSNAAAINALKQRLRKHHQKVYRKMWKLRRAAAYRRKRGWITRLQRHYMFRKSMKEWKDFKYLRLNSINLPLLVKLNWDQKKHWSNNFFFKYSIAKQFFKKKMAVRVFFY